MTAEGWTAFGAVIQAILTGGAAMGASLTYLHARRSDSSRWVEEQLDGRLLGPETSCARMNLEFFFNERIEPYVQAHLGGVPSANVLAEEDIRRGVELDSFLIGLEHILGLAERRVISDRDLDGDFAYWTGPFLANPRLACLRLYMQRYGFMHMPRRLPAEDPRRIAVCGPLPRGLSPSNGDKLPVLELIEPCVRVPGVLYNTGSRSAAVVDLAAIAGKREATSTFEVAVYEIEASVEAEAALEALDRHQGVSSVDWSGPHRRLFVPAGRSGAWMYDWVGSVDGLGVVPDGRWGA